MWRMRQRTRARVCASSEQKSNEDITKNVFIQVDSDGSREEKSNHLTLESLRIKRICLDLMSWRGRIAYLTSEETVTDFAQLELIGRSRLFRHVLTLIEKFAACEYAVLVQGETGTGKEL